MSDIYQAIQRLFCVDTYVNRGLTLVKGEGVYLLDPVGNKYLDLMSNYGVNLFGYGHEKITAALSNQLEKLTTLHGSFNNDVRAEAAKALVKRCGRGLKQVYFSNSGSEAIEAALKFAVLTTGKKKFVVATHGYHGKTLGALSATSGTRYKAAFAPLLWDFTAVEFGQLEALEKVLSSEISAVILEPVQGEGGIYPPPAGYLNQVSQLCRERGVLLIIDEIQTGCGRTGQFLASQEEVESYDIVCLGKGLAGGIPVGATLVSAQVAAKIPKHIHTSTFGGNPLAAAGILTTLDLLDEELLARVRELGAYFPHQLAGLVGEHPEQMVAVRGVGLMIGLEVGQVGETAANKAGKINRDQLLKALQDHRILAIPAGENVVRFLPPLIIEKSQLDQVVSTLKKILKD